MKRTRETTSDLCRDVAVHLHAELGAHHLLDVSALLAWHMTCREFYGAWRDPVYLTKLLTDALALARLLHDLDRRLARATARVILLDCRLLTLRMGEELARRCCLSDGKCMELDCPLDTRYVINGVSTRNIVSALKDPRLQDGLTGELPARVRDAFWRAIDYVRQRHGWSITLRRQKALSGVSRSTLMRDVKHDQEELEYDDQLEVQLAPELYMK